MTLITIGRLRQQQGRLDEAEAKYRDALAIFEKALGPGVGRLPYSLKILLENLLRREDGGFVKSADVA